MIVYFSFKKRFILKYSKDIYVLIGNTKNTQCQNADKYRENIFIKLGKKRRDVKNNEFEMWILNIFERNRKRIDSLDMSRMTGK